MTAAPRVDVHPSSPGVTSLHTELGWLATSQDVKVDALDAMLVKFLVVAKAHDVAQEPRLIDLRPAVADLNTAPIGLARHETIAFEQMAGQRFGHRLLIVLDTQKIRLGSVLITFDVQTIQLQAIEFSNRLAFKLVWS